MNIVEKIKQDVVNFSVSNEIELLCKALKTYMVNLNMLLEREGNISFDYCGGYFSSHGYFDFNKDFLFIIDCDDRLTSLKLFNRKSVNIELKFHTKSQNITYWSHSVLSLKAKDDISELIRLINLKINEIKL